MKARAHVAGAVAVCAAAMAWTRPGAAPDPGAPPRHRAAAFEPSALSVGCAGCHADHDREWRASRHAVALDNPLFRAEWEPRREPWCAGCHAPTTPTPVRDLDPRARDGVGCAACHVRGGRIVAASRAPDSPHDTRVDPAFATPSLCAGCHEFSFPILDAEGRAVGETHEPMQATVTEVSEALGERGHCGGCHMRSGRTGHRFPGAHDPVMLDRAVALSACRRGERLELAVRNRNPAHRLPTGGVNRHLLVRAWRSSRPEARFEARLGRRFRPDPTGGKRTTEDTTLGPGQIRPYDIPLAALGPDSEPINLAIRYVYARQELGEPLAGAARARTIERRRVLADELPPCE